LYLCVVCDDGSGVACVKVTALGKTEILRHVSLKIEFLRKKQGHCDDIMDALSTEEHGQVERIVARMEQLSEHAVNSGVSIMYDAEQSYFQPAIRWLVLQQMKKYNKTKPIVYSTYQCYLKDAEKMVAEDIALAKDHGFHFAAKMVRGAYMTQEIERAREIGYPIPIHPSYRDTEHCYHSILDSLLELVKMRCCRIIVASHNEDTVKFVLTRMKKMGISHDNPAVSFAQLLGMSDNISYLLGKHDFRVYKYMPYGPVLKVMPYLGRRAEENKSVAKGAKKDMKLMREELKRRIMKTLKLA
jgi:proline dehydrogenase